MEIACTLSWPSDVFTWTYVQVCAFYTWTSTRKERERRKKNCTHNEWLLYRMLQSVQHLNEFSDLIHLNCTRFFFSLSMFLATINFTTIILKSSADCLSKLHQVWQNIHTFSIRSIFFFSSFQWNSKGPKHLHKAESKSKIPILWNLLFSISTFYLHLCIAWRTCSR